MTQWHEKSRRKTTGGIRTSRRRRDKRLTEKGGNPTLTEIAEKEDRRSKKAGRGYTDKNKSKRAKIASIANPKTKKTEKAEIVSVQKNDANRLYVRRNIITKGAIISVKVDGKERKAKVTSRPGQQGQVQAVLAEEAEKKAK